MHTVFSFFVFHIAQLGIDCQEFGCLSEGNYLCGSCLGWTETMQSSFCHRSPSRKSGGCENFSWELWAFPHVTWLDLISARVVKVQPRAGAHRCEQDPNISAFQKQLGSRVRQIYRQIISAQYGEHSDGVGYRHAMFCDVVRFKGGKYAHALGLKQQNTEI